MCVTAVYDLTPTVFYTDCPTDSEVRETPGFLHHTRKMAHIRPPKLCKLTHTEKIASYLNWQAQVIYNLHLDNDFTQIMLPDNSWTNLHASATHDYADDADPITQIKGVPVCYQTLYSY